MTRMIAFLARLVGAERHLQSNQATLIQSLVATVERQDVVLAQLSARLKLIETAIHEIAETVRR